jgi:fatty-acyl-CoA synthase
MTISDRTKDVIKSGGEWISSVELENAVMAHPTSSRRPSSPSPTHVDDPKAAVAAERRLTRAARALEKAASELEALAGADEGRFSEA